MSRAYVEYREQDLSSYVDVGDSIYAAFVLPALRGRVNTPVLPGRRENFLKQYTPNGKVPVGASTGYFSVLAAYKGGNNIIVVRAASESAKYAGALIDSASAASNAVHGVLDPSAVTFTETQSFYLHADNQGDWGNGIAYSIHSFQKDTKVAIAENELTLLPEDSAAWSTGYPVKLLGKAPTGTSVNTTYYAIKTATGIKLATSPANAAAGTAITFAAEADTSTYLTPAVNYTTIPNTYRLNIYKSNNLSTPVETYIISKSRDTIEGVSYYLEDVLKNSIWVSAVDNEFVSTIADVPQPKILGEGSDGDPITTGDMMRALASLQNKKRWSTIKAIGDAGYTVPAYQQAIKDLAVKRTDLVAITSAPISTQTNEETAASEIVQFRKVDQNINSSYAALYAPHLEIYDEGNDRDIFVAPDGFAIAAILQTASNYEIWYPPAGNKRGVVAAKGVKVHFSEEDQDFLYDNGINPIIFEEGEGIKIWGQKTLQAEASMLDRLNVRLLLITLGPAITKFLDGTLFEFNDSDTRADIKAKVDAYMETVKSRRGVTSYLTVCDETNNTQSDIDNHVLVFDLIVCPNQSVEKVRFTVAITSEGKVSLQAQAV